MLVLFFKKKKKKQQLTILKWMGSGKIKVLVEIQLAILRTVPMLFATLLTLNSRPFPPHQETNLLTYFAQKIKVFFA